MKALSLRQPWAWLVCNGHKPVENRSWVLPKEMLGQTFLIHASQRMTRKDHRDAVERAESVDPNLILPPHRDLKMGGIVGSVKVVGCLRPDSLLDQGRAKEMGVFGWWDVTGFGFVLAQPKTLPFVECPGLLNFWNVSEEVLRKLNLQGNE